MSDTTAGLDTAAAVREIYEAFARGDVPAIIDRIADDCAWESWEDSSTQRAGLEITRPRSGPQGAAEFFEYARAVEIHDFQVLDILASDRQAAAEVVIALTTPQGRRLRDEECHLWTFDADGKVTRLRHYVDTAKHIAAYS